jgi:uncharacterized membrane protein YhiD involved in acid resistance
VECSYYSNLPLFQYFITPLLHSQKPNYYENYKLQKRGGIVPGLYETFQMLSRLIIAALCGNIVGLAYKDKNRNTAMYVLVVISLGSALFTLISGSLEGSGIALDSAPVSAPLIIAVGLIAGAVVMRSKDTQNGLRLAAGVWICGALGLAVGVGLYFLAIIVTLISFFILQKIKFKSEEEINI